MQGVIGRNIGNYQIVQALAEGGMGAVYLAVHPQIGKRVAIKILHRELSQNPELVSRFFQEARAVNEIGHPNIVDISDFGGTEDGLVYLVMELLDGQTLAERLRMDVRLPVPEALAIALQVADALGGAHAKGVVHRDLKPDNIFLRGSGPAAERVKLLDFGVAKLVGRDGEASHKTAAGLVMGTPHYMAPEQVLGVEVDWRADIWALAVVLFEMVTGRKPFEHAQLLDLLTAVTRDPAPSPRDLAPDLPSSLDAFILHCLAKNPAQRPADMNAFIDALRAVGADSSALDGGGAMGRLTPPPMSALPSTSSPSMPAFRTPPPMSALPSTSSPSMPAFRTPPPMSALPSTSAPTMAAMVSPVSTVSGAPAPLAPTMAAMVTPLSTTSGAVAPLAPTMAGLPSPGTGTGRAPAPLAPTMLAQATPLSTAVPPVASPSAAASPARVTATRTGAVATGVASRPAEPGAADRLRAWATTARGRKQLAFGGGGLVVLIVVIALATGSKPAPAPAVEAPVAVAPAPAGPVLSTVELDSTPQGAEVFRVSDGRLIGITPARDTEIADGREVHYRFRLRGYAEVRTAFRFQSPGSHPLMVRLAELGGRGGGAVAEAATDDDEPRRRSGRSSKKRSSKSKGKKGKSKSTAAVAAPAPKAVRQAAPASDPMGGIPLAPATRVRRLGKH